MKNSPQSKLFTTAEPLRVSIVDVHPYELQPVNPTNFILFQPIRSQDLTVTPKIEKLPKMKFGKTKADTSVPIPHGIPEEEKQGKIDIRRARKVTHKHNTRSRVNHVTTFNNSPKTFKMDTYSVKKHTSPRQERREYQTLF